MKAKSLPDFLNGEHMVFINNFTQEEYISVLNMTKNGPVTRIQVLGQGKVLWFNDSRELLIFLMKYG
jgi:hypothetical protein